MDETLRRYIWERAGDICEYCHLPQQFDLLPFQIDHIIFAWQGPALQGLTAIGRTTIGVLGMNHAARLEHRRLLMQAGIQFST